VRDQVRETPSAIIYAEERSSCCYSRSRVETVWTDNGTSLKMPGQRYMLEFTQHSLN